MSTLHAVALVLIGYGAYFVIAAGVVAALLFAASRRLEIRHDRALDQEIADLMEDRLPPASITPWG
jgi:hypothetical protein